MKLVALICLVSGSIFAAGITPGGGGGISFPPGTGGGSLTPTTNNTNFIIGIATNLPNLWVTGQVVVGNPLTGIAIRGDNGVGTGSGLPFVRWNTYLDYNSNTVFVATCPTALFNGQYNWNGTVYTNANGSGKGITNSSYGWGLTASFDTAPKYTNIVSLFSTNWVNNTVVFTNTFTKVTAQTNAPYAYQTFGSSTNLNGVTNNAVMLGSSNGVPILVTSAPNSTNQTLTVLLPVYFPSGQNITNMYTTNVTLDFPSTTANVAILPVTITGTELGDTVVVNSAGDNNLSINGTFSGSASNNTVFVRFNAVGAAQDPASQLFRITVLKAR